jgi:hypothetical protein
MSIDKLKKILNSPEDNSSLEDKFKAEYDVHFKEIEDNLIKASKYLSDAIAIAEEHGIPFRSEISFLYNDYVPESFESKWKGISRSEVATLTEVYDFNGSSWLHSAVC